MLIKNLVVIPARYKSSRFPGKVIADLCGKPVVQRVYESCLQSHKADRVLIATDHKEVYDICKQFTDNVVMTSEKHQFGTDRIREAIDLIECENVVNIQGDEPFISKNVIDSLFAELEVSEAPMVSAFHKIDSEEELKNPNIVKVVTNSNGYAVYFSRSPIPYIRAPLTFNDVAFKRHLGVYGYKAHFLKEYVNMPHSTLENAEQLEQLRVVEAGYQIKLIETPEISIGIDTPEDLQKAIKQIKNEG